MKPASTRTWDTMATGRHWRSKRLTQLRPKKMRNEEPRMRNEKCLSFLILGSSFLIFLSCLWKQISDVLQQFQRRQFLLQPLGRVFVEAEPHFFQQQLGKLHSRPAQDLAAGVGSNGRAGFRRELRGEFFRRGIGVVGAQT